MDDIETPADAARLDPALIQRLLSMATHWARGISLALVERSIHGSLCFAASGRNERGRGDQMACAYVVTDSATSAYRCDVCLPSAWRSYAIARRLLDVVIAHLRLQVRRRFAPATRDAPSLYARYGLTVPIANPSTWMERHNPNVYSQERYP